MYKQRSVAVVVPAFNEQDRICNTVRSVPQFVDWVVVVDDGSSDATVAMLRSVDRRGLTVIRHRKNRGVGAAIISGYQQTEALGADFTAVMAGDNQMDPADLPPMLDVLVCGKAGYVKGNRFLHPDVWRAMPSDRILGNILLSLMTRVASGYYHIFDSQCGYTAICRDALRRLDLKRVYSRYGYCNDLLAHLNVAGIEVVDVPVRPVYNGADSGIRIPSVVRPMMKMLVRSFVRRQRAAFGSVVETFSKSAGGNGRA